MVWALLDVIAEELAERALRPSLAGQDAALDDDLGLGGNHEVDTRAGSHRHGAATDGIGDRHLVRFVGYRGTGAQKDLGRCTEQDGDVERLVSRFGLGLVAGQVMRRRQSHAQFRVAHHHCTREGQVGNPGVRLTGEEHARSQVGPGVALAVLDSWQRAEVPCSNGKSSDRNAGRTAPGRSAPSTIVCHRLQKLPGVVPMSSQRRRWLP